MPLKVEDPATLERIASREQAVERSLIDPAGLEDGLAIRATPGEFELLDAVNLTQRGDYSGTVRRVTTAIEVVVAAMPKHELSKSLPEKDADAVVEQTTMRFTKRTKTYERASARALPAVHLRELRRTRTLRNKIVHGGLRIEKPKFRPVWNSD